MERYSKQDCLNPRTAHPSCGCGHKQKMQPDMMPNCDSMEHLALAMCYVPWQHWDKIYDLEKGLECGTIFPELNKPFLGSRCC
ncbi:spore coat associated protein JA (CotJA) [Lachnotalea glycerini]|uniref:Spore coat associated protein JA (CotJA) n=2 Tax=Lachnotalea glycerini TaxID=1763509 RepID=A0A318EXL4_9FIRM|nr:spore coat associated protein CotJA [Lachnotalea glycerini]PXV96253.1 spore coat associated protein JA (CotJA) [Lachnotalea glycerini]